ncbi:MAG: DUF262 domain-containing protein [Bacteroidales bacterium]|nr:DUF262 domain-containing protein [Bacteroidales bacterium]
MTEILKPVSKLLGMKFFIPSYQRGYRWTESQITALLNDICTFDKSKDGEFYCLQPLVVKYDDNKWHVIDGQQRLTTIYLILKVLGDKNPFELEYERDSYIKCLDVCDGVCTDNIEIFHLTTAREIIKDWLDKKLTDEQKESLKSKLMDQTKFIFYNVGALCDYAEHDLFNNLNSGKIALTNAELIKALFLNKVGNEDVVHREVEQRLLADEFDQIERTLRQDDFWYFLAGNTTKTPSCINLLFELMFEADEKVDKKKYPEYERFRTFFYFNDLINANREKSYSKSKDLWEEVRRVFHVMEGWFNDSVMYNLIGYHRAVNRKSLADIFTKFNNSKSKHEFKDWLKEECKEYISYPDEFMNLRYDTNKSEVLNLLLLFNIATLLKKPQEHVKFSFASFHNYKWDVEHISPQNPKDIEAIKQKLRDCNSNHIFDSLLQKDVVDEEMNKFFADDDELMGLGNLTLLTAHDNRGIGNKFFFEKRNKLQEYYQDGSFIPTCSLNVFLKFYTEEPDQMLFWDENDRKDYTQEIKSKITDFFESKPEQL